MRILKAIFLCFLLPAGGVSAEEKSHVVRSGETLSGIAQGFGLRSQDLIFFNSLKNPNDLAVGQTLKIPPKAGVATAYTVKEGDSIGKIAHKHGISGSELVALNELKDPDNLSIGQSLLLPSGSTVAASPRSSAQPAGPAGTLDAQFKRTLDNTPVKTGRWKYIVVHHSGTRQGSAAGMDQYHRRERRMENGLAYHFVIGNGRGAGDGAIEIGSRWKRQIKGGHLASTALNEKSIGICLVGNFNERKPTARQMQSLEALLRYLLARCKLGISSVRTHRQINTKPTLCPGQLFPTRTMLNEWKP